jgi:hypothetical protein
VHQGFIPESPLPQAAVACLLQTWCGVSVSGHQPEATWTVLTKLFSWAGLYPH